MKKLMLLALLTVGMVGCIGPNWKRLASEDKDYDAILNTPYGRQEIHSRVATGTNRLAPLPQPVTVTPVNGLLIR